MALSTILLTLVFAVAAHLLVRFQHERRRGKLVWGRLVIPFGKTAEWLLYFSAMVFAIDYLGRSLPGNVDSAIAHTRPAQTAEPGHSTAPGPDGIHGGPAKPLRQQKSRRSMRSAACDPAVLPISGGGDGATPAHA